MNGRWLLSIALVAGAMAVFSPAIKAHHGTSTFDMSRTTTIKGTVVDYQLINPHSELTIKVQQDDGTAVEWNVESVSATMLIRVGWKRDTVKTGDTVSVTGHPAKGGKPAMLLVKAVLPDGRELSTAYE
jgi:hypothetical protein